MVIPVEIESPYTHDDLRRLTDTGLRYNAGTLRIPALLFEAAAPSPYPSGQKVFARLRFRPRP